MSPKGVFFLLTITTSLMLSRSSRELPGPDLFESELDSQARDCWSAIPEIRSCSNEIVAYFASGTIDISPQCCEAIAQITHNCWPDLLGPLGFGPDQAYILRGYCDATIAEGFGPVSSPMGQPWPAMSDGEWF